MIQLKFDYSQALAFLSEEAIKEFQPAIDDNYKSLLEKTGKGNDFLGWVTLPDEVDEALLTQIETTASLIRSKAEVLVVIGIGGSYLGARAVIDALTDPFDAHAHGTRVVYAGQNISEDYMTALMRYLDKKSYAIAVISKSGTTTEPAIAFRLLKSHLENKVGLAEARSLIVAITDKSRGALKQLATEEGYVTYVVPDDVGGRYSVLTPVGLLPIAVAGFDIRALVQGAKDMKSAALKDTSIDNNPVSAYAAVRNALYAEGKSIEVMVNYEPSLYYITEWWKQLYGESEGKEGEGIFPAGVSFTTDLHSMGQYLQEGKRNLFETVLSIEKPASCLEVPADDKNLDGLNYIAGRRIHDVNFKAEQATTLAHVDGGVPNLRVILPEINEQNIGELLYFYELACGISGYLLGVNPFDQPGVEAYKKNMFALLGKPGFESETEALLSRL